MNKDVLAVPPCQITWIDYHGWRGVELSNELIRAVVVPDIGGRIMEFSLKGHNYLWNNDDLLGRLFSREENQGDGSLANWKNYGGSKTWPAPQGWERGDQWHGPPDPVLDSGRFGVQSLSAVGHSVSVRVSSPEDPRTGIRIARELSLHPGGSHATLHLEMSNVSDQERTWSLWDVVQLDVSRGACVDRDDTVDYDDASWLYIPLNPKSCFPNGYEVLFGDRDNSEWHPNLRPGLMAVHYQYRVGKIGVDAAAGWLAQVNQRTNYAFCQRFTHRAGATYPDGGASVECWTMGLGEIEGLDLGADTPPFMEAEILGPMRTMAPGESHSLDIEWYAARCPGPILDVSPVGCCHQPLTAEWSGHRLRLKGVFGPFFLGAADLVWLDAEGRVCTVETLGSATPTDVLSFDVLRMAPSGARTVELRVKGRDGVALGSLGSCPLC